MAAECRCTDNDAWKEALDKRVLSPQVCKRFLENLVGNILMAGNRT